VSEGHRHDADEDLLAEFGQVLREQTGPDAANDDEIDGYRLDREIYRGGQGVVLAAYQETTKRPVAIKLMLDGALASEQDRARFEREIELAAQLQHPSIVAVHESGRTRQGRQYISMEMVDGVRFDVFVRERYHAGGAPDAEKCAEIVRLYLGVCDAIEYAHRRGVIHRDIKPGNVMVTDEGRPVVLDFGIAKAAGAERGATKTGDFLGTLSYAAPEQLGGSPELIDTRADVYALGVVLYEALTGVRPSGGDDTSIAKAIRSVTEEDARRASSVNPSVSRDLDAVLRRALERDPGQRYQTAGQLREELSRSLEGRPVRAREHERAYLAKKFLVRHRVPIAVIGCLLVFGALAGGSGVQTILKARQASRFADVTRTVVEPIAGIDFETAQPVEMVRDLVGLLDQISSDVDERLDGYPRYEAPLRSTIGLAYLGQRELPSAERELQEALTLWQSVPHAKPATIASAHHDLGRARWSLAKYGEAEEVYREALRIRTGLRGPDDLDTARTTHHLAATLQGKSEFGESERLWLEAIRVRRAMLDPGHPDIPNTLVGYGTFLHETGRHREARAQYDEALGLARALSAEDDWRTARTAYGLAACLVDLEELPQARKLLDGALPVQLAHGDEFDIVRTRVALARLDLAEGRDLAGALLSVSNSIERLIALNRADHPEFGAAYTLEARLLLAMDRPDDAEASARLAIASLDSRWGRRSWRTGQALGVLAQALIDQDRSDEAIEPATRSQEILASVRDKQDPIRRESENRAGLLGLAPAGSP